MFFFFLPPAVGVWGQGLMLWLTLASNSALLSCLVLQILGLQARALMPGLQSMSLGLGIISQLQPSGLSRGSLQAVRHADAELYPQRPPPPQLRFETGTHVTQDGLKLSV